MAHRWVAPLVIGGFLVGSCSTESSTPTGVATGAADASVAPTYLVNTTVKGSVSSVFVTVRQNAPVSRLQLAMSEDVRAGGELAGGQILALEVSTEALPKVVETLRRVPWIESVAIGNDDNKIQADNLTWGVTNTGADQVNALFGNRGTGIKVAFLDTGVDCSHPDLSSRVVGGYDFVNGSSTYCVYYDVHGTGVAGIIAASINGTGVIGMAPEAALYSLRVCDASGCLSARIALALQWASTHGMQVVNMSLANCGAAADPAVALAATQAYNAGVVLVAGAGNGTAERCPPNSPVSGIARLPEVIAVSAMNANFTTPSGYQYGPEVDLAAPTNVRTDTLLGGTATSFGGTSGSTPHVSGAVALLLKQGYPASAVYSRLTSEATDRGAVGKDNFYGYGSLDALAAVQPKPYAQT